MEVKLEWHEMLIAAVVAAMRQIGNLKRGRLDRYGASFADGFSLHMQGCLGEMAVAKALDIYWNGNLNNLNAADVGNLQVRTRSKHHYDLIVHPKDKDADAFILVTGEGDTYRLQGWCYGEEAKVRAYWKDPAGGRAAYFVPQSALNSLSLLKRSLRAKPQRKGVGVAA